MTAALKVLVCSYLDAQCERMLKESLADCDLSILDNASLSEKVDPGFLDAEVVFGNVPPSWLSQGSCLRWMQLDSIAEVVFGNVPPSWLSQGSCLRWMQLDSTW